MSTTITITLNGKPHFKASVNRRMTEEEVHAVVTEGLIGINPELADINIYHEF